MSSNKGKSKRSGKSNKDRRTVTDKAVTEAKRNKQHKSMFLLVLKSTICSKYRQKNPNGIDIKYSKQDLWK